MGLLDRIGRIFGRQERTAQTVTTGVTARGELPSRPEGARDWVGDWRAVRDRQAQVQACREMYETDPRGEMVISTLARDIVRGGFDVEVDEEAGSQGEQALEIAEDLRDRLDLDQRLDDWGRYALRDGDAFLELGVDADLNIVEATRKPTLAMRRNSDQYDRFPDPQRAFWLAAAWENEPGPDTVWFAEWQIIHARWHHDEGQRYGRPLFASATSSFKRMVAGETDLAVRRKTRAGQKYLHKFPPGTAPETIEQYKLLNRDALDNPVAAIADFFGTVDVSAVQGDAQLGQIDDVMHHIRTWFLASPLAMSLVGYGQDLNRDVLEKQEEQYQRALEGLTAWPTTEIVRPLLERQWLLKGIWPASLGYRIKWRAKSPLTADAVEKAANAGLKLRAVGAPTEVVRAVIEQLLPGVDLGEVWTAADVAGSAPGLGANGGATPAVRETRARPGRIAQVASELGGVIR